MQRKVYFGRILDITTTSIRTSSTPNGHPRRRNCSSTCTKNSAISGQPFLKELQEGTPGEYYRSDNCVKNHFYSKIRKSARKLNKIIHEIHKEEYRPIKNCMLSKIIEIT